MAGVVMKLSFAAAVLLPVISAELIGRSSTPQLPSHPEIIEVSITNTGKEHISILALNNLFDRRPLAIPFRLNDTDGKEIMLDGIRVTSAGIDKEDMIDLLPGSNFTRQVNLTRHLVNSAGSPARTIPAILSLPRSFDGLNHTGVYSIPKEASAVRKQDGTITPGDLAAASLTRIELASEPLHINVNIPPGPPSLSARTQKRDRHGKSGMYAHPDCTGNNKEQIDFAIDDAAYLARAGVAAIHNRTINGDGPNLYPWFFGYEAEKWVERVANVLIHLIESAEDDGGTFIPVRCTDTSPKDPVTQQGRCANDNTLAYARGLDPETGIATVTFCPLGLELPRNPWPCTEVVGLVPITLGHAMVHEALHIQNLAGFQTTGLGGDHETYGSGPAHSLAFYPLGGAERNPDNYAWLCSWASVLGFGGAPYNGAVCMQNFIGM